MGHENVSPFTIAFFNVIQLSLNSQVSIIDFFSNYAPTFRLNGLSVAEMLKVKQNQAATAG